MSQNSKWSSWQQLKPTKQETITEPVEPTTIGEPVTPVEESIVEAIDEQPSEEVAPKPVKKRNVNV